MNDVIGRVVSVNVGTAREIEWRGRSWRTAIFKAPVEESVRVEGVQVAGDEQADLSVHGGPSKSVYAYPHEHYAFWSSTLTGSQADIVRTPGAFGENLTTEGLLERDAGVGDVLRIGTAHLRVTEPRLPCSKLGLRFDDPQMTKLFHHAGRNGIYFAIEEAGEIAAGDEIAIVERHPERLTIQEIVDVHAGRAHSADVRERALRHPALLESWKAWFSESEVAE